MKRVSKLHENKVEELSPEQEEIARALEKITAGRFWNIETYLMIPICYITALALLLVPHFNNKVFKEIQRKDQPFTFIFNQKFQISTEYISPFIVSMISFYILKLKGDILVSSLIPISIVFTSRIFPLINSSFAFSISFLFYILGLLLSHNLLVHDPYSWKWFRNYIMGTFLCVLSIYFSPDFVGPCVGVYIACFISSFTRLGTCGGNKPKMVWEIIVLFFMSYIVLIPAILALSYCKNSYPSNPVRRYTVRLMDYIELIKEEEDYFELFAVVFGLFLYKFSEKRYISIVPLIQMVCGILATMFIPYESFGIPIETRFFCIKMQLFLMSAIILSKTRFDKLRIIVSSLILIVLGAIKTIDMVELSKEELSKKKTM